MSPGHIVNVYCWTSQPQYAHQYLIITYHTFWVYKNSSFVPMQVPHSIQQTLRSLGMIEFIHITGILSCSFEVLSSHAIYPRLHLILQCESKSYVNQVQLLWQQLPSIVYQQRHTKDFQEGFPCTHARRCTNFQPCPVCDHTARLSNSISKWYVQ